MATGDIKNNLRKLRVELKKINFTNEIDLEQMSIGVTGPFLPILHFVFADYSSELTASFLKKGYDFYGKSDLRFVEVIFKILVQEFGLKPMLTKHQFFTLGYAEVKVIFITKIVFLCWQRNQEIRNKLGKKKKLSSQKTNRIPIQADTSEVKRGAIEIDQTLYDTSRNNANCNIVQRHTHLVEPPIPNPELALTPLKDTSKRATLKGLHQFSANEENTLMGDDEKQMESHTEEWVEDDAELEHQNSSEFESKVFVTKHTDRIISHSSVQNNVTPNIDENFKSHVKDPLDLTLDQPDDLLIDYASVLPSNITVIPLDCEVNGKEIGHCLKQRVKLSDKPKQSDIAAACSIECSKCQKNSVRIDKLASLLNEMEKKFNDIVCVNNGLSAKLILLETKMKLNNCKIDESTENEVSASLECYVDLENNQKIIASNVPMDTKPSDQISTHSEYSPVKYTDDDVIVKNFKPLRMSDVRKLYSENKENQSTMLSKSPQNYLTQGEKVQLDSTNKFEYQDWMFDTTQDVDTSFKSKSTKETMRNVTEKLAETDQILKTKAGHLLK